MMRTAILSRCRDGAPQAREAARLSAVAVLALLMLIAGQAALPVTDRDEARFVQASRQMLQSNDYIDIRFQERPRYKKPVGIYWLQSAAATLSGQGAQAPLWVFRLPSLLGMVLAATLTAWLGAALVGRQAAAFAGLLVVASIVPGIEARLATTDAALLAASVLMQGVLARLWMGQALRGAGALFWLAGAVAILLKGPIAPMIAALTAATASLMRRETAWLRPLAAWRPILLAAALALPWFIAITAISDGDFWRGSVGEDLLAKAAAGQEGKGAPPGSYLLATGATFWPGAVLVALTLGAAVTARKQPAMQFLIAWVLPGWLVFELLPTKLVHYTMPFLPTLALMASGLWLGGASVARVWRVIASLGVLIGPALLAAFHLWAVRQGGGPPVFPLLIAGLLAVAAVPMLWRDRRRMFLAALICMGACVSSGLVLTAAATPRLFPSQRAWAEARRISPCAAPRLIGWGYREPSLVWLGGIRTLLVDGTSPLPAAPGRCDVVIRAEDARAPLPRDLHETEVIEGYALGAGRWVRLHVLQSGASVEHLDTTAAN